MHVCMYVCMYVCVYIYIYIYTYIYTHYDPITIVQLSVRTYLEASFETSCPPRSLLVLVAGYWTIG